MNTGGFCVWFFGLVCWGFFYRCMSFAGSAEHNCNFSHLKKTFFINYLLAEQSVVVLGIILGGLVVWSVGVFF